MPLDKLDKMENQATPPFLCQACGGELKNFNESFKCQSCSKNWHAEEGIPLLFWANEWKDKSKDVTESIKAFYEKTPFPNYDDLDSAQSLREKAYKGIFARLLDEQIPYDANIFEAGCGTGQLSNFLATTWGRTVVGADLCLNSLKLAQKFKKDNSIENVTFAQMNLFKPALKPESFDFVISNGVLHHTSNPRLGFQSISKLLKRGGFIVIGLYNKYWRLQTDLRRFMFNISGNRFKKLDPHLRENISDGKKTAWFMDQYKNPHESKHTIDEVLKWFNEDGFEFMNSIPKSIAIENFSADEKLFEPHEIGTKTDHILVQTKLIFTGGREGGFFVMIGKKK